MKPFLAILSFLVILLGSAWADVIPIIDDRPLALRPDPIPSLASDRKIPPSTLDGWLNFRVNSDQTGQVQNEQQIVVNPQNPQNVVAVWRDFRLGYRRVGVGYSLDGGWTWQDDLFPQVGHPWQSDPAMTYHSSGAIYACVLSLEPDMSQSGIFVSLSNDGGVSWEPFIAAVDTQPDTFEDKEMMACDRSGSTYDGYLYIAWTRFTNFQSTSRITMVRSTTGGQSWDAPVPVSDDTGVQWPVAAVGPDGQVYIAWVDYDPESIKLDVSYDGGQTWGSDHLVQSTAFASGYINPLLLIFAFPAMDADITTGPYRGNLYIAYSDMVGDETDLFFTRSENGGRDWSTPLRVNDDAPGNGCDQFHPWLVCDENGVLHLIFYDRRNDPHQNLYMDVYYTYSNDAGLTWSPNERITTVSSNPDLDSLDSGLIGEYNGLAARGGIIHPIWTDTRNFNQDNYTAVWDTITGLPQENPFPSSPSARVHLHASPNPFNETIQISLTLPAPANVKMAVYDLTGRRLAMMAEGQYEAGTIARTWTARSGSGIYMLVADTSLGRACQKIVYLK